MCFLGVFVVTIILSVVADRYISPRLKLSCPLHASSCLSIRSTSSVDTLVVDWILRDNRRSHANSPRICCFTAAADEPFDARYRSEEHTSELQSLMRISYAVFCLKKKKTIKSTDEKTYTQPSLNIASNLMTHTHIIPTQIMN